MMDPSAILLDTTVLSNFAHVRRGDLLELAVGIHGAVTPSILAEVRAGEESGHLPKTDWRWLTTIAPTPAERDLASTFVRQLDSGEAECLAVAAMRGCLFLSDDLAARRLAQSKGVAVSGTLGILVRLIEASHITLSEADSLLAQMIEQGYRSPIQTISVLISG